MNNTELSTFREESRPLAQMKPTKLDNSLFSKELAPHYMKLAGQLAASEIVPKCYRNKPSDLFLCWAKGYQLGIPPEQAMDCISVINGKAVMWGDDMLALCMAHPEFDDIIEEALTDANHNVIGYSCTVKRKGKADKKNIFTLEMAKKAGLLAKGGVWIQYTDRMLKLRARGFTLRDAFPDALKGIKPREEVEDYIEAEYKVVDQKGSRTELLKNDFMTKKGGMHDRTPVNVENTEAGEETANGEVEQPVEKTGEETHSLHLKIKELIDEKGFADERLQKALSYYEVTAIEDLNTDSAHHFAIQLLKL